ncbi:hypothetical protein OsJ_29126 [Oryza sativa Japonica Group]|uniref:Uncharacterized protein n=1 Tax=Oryza sativa subsp. japonica TaxID=39947 RepID=B9G387_ORYSJ|nr:hypothetical protein OsJ_29126 [Oryza sativa Japonica Group]
MWDRQKAKLQEDIAECKTKITQVDRELAEINKAIRNMEVFCGKVGKTIMTRESMWPLMV